MPSLAAPLTLAPKLLITRPRSGQRNAGWPLAAMPAGPAEPASSAGGSTVVATRAFADGSADAVFVGTAVGGAGRLRGCGGGLPLGRCDSDWDREFRSDTQPRIRLDAVGDDDVLHLDP